MKTFDRVGRRVVALVLCACLVCLVSCSSNPPEVEAEAAVTPTPTEANQPAGATESAATAVPETEEKSSFIDRLTSVDGYPSLDFIAEAIYDTHKPGGWQGTEILVAMGLLASHEETPEADGERLAKVYHEIRQKGSENLAEWELQMYSNYLWQIAQDIVMTVRFGEE